MGQDFSDHRRFQDRSDGFEVFAPAVRAVFHVDLEDASQEFGPSDSVGFLRTVGGLCLRSSWGRLLGNLLLLGHDQGADFCVRSKASEKSRQVDPGWRDKGRELLHEFEA